MKNRVYIIIAFLLLASCRTPKPVVVTEKITETITETKHDTIFEIQADTATLKALIDCRNQKPIIKIIESTSGTGTLKKPNITLTDSLLTIDCEAKAQLLFAEWKSKSISKEVIRNVPVYVEKELTSFQKVLLWLGKILLLLILIVAIVLIIKTYKIQL